MTPQIIWIPRGFKFSQRATLRHKWRGLPDLSTPLHWDITNRNEGQYETVGGKAAKHSKRTRFKKMPSNVFWSITCTIQLVPSDPRLISGPLLNTLDTPQPTQPLAFNSVAAFATDSFALLEVKHLKFCRPLDPMSLEKELKVWVWNSPFQVWNLQSHLFGIADSFWAFQPAESPFERGLWGRHDPIFGS